MMPIIRIKKQTASSVSVGGLRKRHPQHIMLHLPFWQISHTSTSGSFALLLYPMSVIIPHFQKVA